MQLLYKIEYHTTNSYFKGIIENLIKLNGISATCKQYKGFIILICEDEASKIEEFFKNLETALPISIFLGKASVIESIPEGIEELEAKDIKQNLTMLTNKHISRIIENNNIDFLNDIVKITKGEISRFETHNGLKDLFLPNKELREDFESKGYEVKLLITNLNKVTELFEVSPKDMQLLCSLERPLVKLKFKLLENKNNEYSSTKFIYAKIPDDKETLLFAKALQEEGIDFLLYVNDDVYQDGLKVTYFNDQNIIVRGDKGLFPKFDYTANKKFNSSKEYFDENGGVYRAILAQSGKRISSSIGVYFSQNSNKSAILINLPTKGLKEVIAIPNVYNSIENCLEEIEEIDENSQRLVKNYKNKFASFFETDVPKEAYGFESIMNMCAKVLGLSNAKEFEAVALNVNSKSGIQIDMKLVNIEGVNYLDYRKVVQSIMSFKMADVDNGTLAFSFFESLSEFVSNYVTEIEKDIKAKDVVLCGDMFANSILLSKTDKNLSKSYNVILPKEYPLDY